MYFNIKRYIYGMLRRKWMFLFIFVIPVAFLTITAVIPDRYVIIQGVDIRDQAPVALMTDPVGFLPFKQFLLTPSSFFINSYTLTKLESDVMPGRAGGNNTNISDIINESMSLKRIDDKTVQVVYSGKNRETGEILVGFYSDRLIKKANEGLIRSKTIESGTKPSLSGDMEFLELKALWRSDRVVPLWYCIGVSFALVLILFGVLEWNDSSLKSERQIARYCGLPILGNIPDLNKVARVLDSKNP